MFKNKIKRILAILSSSIIAFQTGNLITKAMENNTNSNIEQSMLDNVKFLEKGKAARLGKLRSKLYKLNKIVENKIEDLESIPVVYEEIKKEAVKLQEELSEANENMESDEIDEILYQLAGTLSTIINPGNPLKPDVEDMKESINDVMMKIAKKIDSIEKLNETKF